MTREPTPEYIHIIECGRLLTRLRLKNTELTQEDVAAALGWSQNKVAYIEGGDRRLQPDDGDDLLKLLNAPDDLAAEVRMHIQGSKRSIPRTHLRWRFKGTMRTVVDLESAATRSYGHASMVLPGLLQTDDYMAELTRMWWPEPTKDDVEQFVDLRRRRQRILDNPDQLFEFAIDHSAMAKLMHIGRGGRVAEQQVARLREVAGQENVKIRFVPNAHGPYRGQEDDYTLYEFDLGPDRDPVQVVYVDLRDSSEVLHDTKALEKYGALWKAALKVGLGPDGALPFLSILSGPSELLS